MIIRVMRHGDAPVSLDDRGQAIRQLSSLGEQEASKMGIWLTQQSKCELMVTSPLIRARQTAELVKTELPYHCTEQIDDAILPEAQTQICAQYCEYLAADLESGVLLVVSHMPLVANLLAYWLPGQRVYFPTAAVAEIEIIDNRARLVRFIKPADL